MDEGSGGGENQRHVVAAEPERVVQHRHRLRAALAERPRLGGDVDRHVLVQVLEVDGGRGHVLVKREDGGHRFDGAFASACASSASPSGVDVACAFTCTTQAGSTWASARAREIAAITPAPSGAGCAM